MRYLALIIILSFFVIFLWWLNHANLIVWGRETVDAPAAFLPINPPAKTKNNNFELAPSHHISTSENSLSESKESHTKNKKRDIKKLMDEQIDNDKRREINARLTSTEVGRVEVKTEYGGSMNLSGSAAAIAIRLVDDDGDLIVVDITRPLALLEEE